MSNRSNKCDCMEERRDDEVSEYMWGNRWLMNKKICFTIDVNHIKLSFPVCSGIQVIHGSRNSRSGIFLWDKITHLGNHCREIVFCFEKNSCNFAFFP